MALMIPTERVVVVRRSADDTKNERVTPPLGKAFNFTAEEIADLRARRPEAIRAPVNETGDVDSMLDLDEGDHDTQRDEDEEQPAPAKPAKPAAAKPAAAKPAKPAAAKPKPAEDDL